MGGCWPASSQARVGTRIVNAMTESLGARIEPAHSSGYRTSLAFDI
jgi:hypothetical protein